MPDCWNLTRAFLEKVHIDINCCYPLSCYPLFQFPSVSRDEEERYEESNDVAYGMKDEEEENKVKELENEIDDLFTK